MQTPFTEDLKQFIKDNPTLVRMSESKSHPGLFVLKYKNKVFYDRLWCKILEECRGTVIDKDFNIIARPFQKIYNYGWEKDAPVLAPETLVTAYQKVNGFMVAVSLYEGKPLVSTTGSLDSDYAKIGERWVETLNQKVLML